MMPSLARTVTLIAFSLAIPQAAFAAPATASGPNALALAAVVARHSLLLTPEERATMALLFAGDTKAGGTAKIAVAAEAITCRASNVAIAERSCELAFGAHKATLKGRDANEIFATLAATGVAADGAAGSIFESLKTLACTIDPVAIRQNDGSGADCSFSADQ
ncbi:MAG: hypothetical protein AB1586_33560 [Pseudomonadota bacterium]